MSPELTSIAFLTSVNPATGVALAQIKISSKAEVEATVADAKAAFKLWRQKKVSERLLYIRRFHEILTEKKAEISQSITDEAGKPLVEALVSEVFAVLEACAWLQDKAETILADKQIDLNPVFFGDKTSYNVFESLGVIAVISPWNYPFSIPATSMLLALVAGNAVVLKPSPKTPLVAQTLVKLFSESGFPEGLIGLVQGGNEQAEALILSGVSRVVFTGSVRGGQAIMQIASQKLVPVTLELGGKHPGIVLPDVDPDKIATALVWSAFTNCGQACASLDRLYLVKPVPEKLLPALIEKTKNIRIGNGSNSDTDVGPLVDSQQLKRMESLVQEAVAGGATILAGGKKRTDVGELFFEPCLISDLQPDMRLAKEEIFGPILPLFFVDSVEEAIQEANKTDFGLAASIWTADEKRGAELSRSLDAGVVWVNDALYSHVCPDAPWGGIKYSGFGKAHAEQELLDMISCKNIGVSAQGKRDWHYPYSIWGQKYIEGGVDLLHQKNWLAKLKAVSKVLSAKLKMKK
ncbi:MAG: aldehyde dehydrogenase family protein [Candidatus Obscuribacterales bacterium]|nr:aldehyde dehydrogenase family protein [Candidatus Obscuribacterales bacterium]